MKRIFPLVLLTIMSLTALTDCGGIKDSSASLASSVSTSGNSSDSKSESSASIQNSTDSESNVTSSSITGASSSTNSATSQKEDNTTNTYINPIYRGSGSEFADPDILRVANTFYGYGTGGEIISSPDLVNWTHVGQVNNPTPWFDGDTRGIWAPCVLHLGSTYNYYYAHSSWGDLNPGIGVMTSSSPIGPFIDHGKIFDSDEIGVTNSIDPEVFKDPASGKIYMYWGSMYGNFAIELSDDGLSTKNKETESEDKIWVAGNKDTPNWDVSSYEGSAMLYYNSKYYLFLSQGTCCDGQASSYHVKVGWSSSPTGPFVSSNGKDLLAGNRGDLIIQGDGINTFGTGHCCLIADDEGTVWIYYHSYIKDTDGSIRGRYLMMDKIVWIFDEPVVNNYVPSWGKTCGPVIYSKN